jgi:hypothetical protein
MACGSASLPNSSPVPSAAGIPVCSLADDQSFRRNSQDDDWAFGAGEAATAQAAYDLAIDEAMRSIEVKIRSETSVAAKETVAAGTSTQSTQVEQDVHVLVEQRRAGCSRENTCQTAGGQVRVRARCSRYSVMEQNLRKASEKLAATLPAQATVMVLPPTDDGDHFTHLGYEAQGVLQRRLQRPLLAPTQKLVVLPQWTPADSLKLWRQHGVTHFVSGSTSSPSGRNVEFRLYLQDAATEEVLPQSLSQFEIALEPQERDKLERKGGLFPQKAAMNLVGTAGNKGGVELRLSATQLREGENVEISLRLAEPAYVYLFDIYENGKASLLIPGPATPNNHLDAGRWYTFPDDNWKKEGYVLKACPIPGDKINRERIKVLATTKPLDLPLDRYTLRDLADMREGPKGQIAEINQRIDELQRAGAGIATAVAAYDITAVADPHTGCPKQ